METPKLQQYEKLIGKNAVYELQLLAHKLKDKKIQFISSDKINSFLTEPFTWIAPLLNEMGVNAQWDMIETDQEYLDTAKLFRNALYGYNVRIPNEKFQSFVEKGDELLSKTRLEGDIIFIFDIEPIFLIKRKDRLEKKWIWRSFLDLSEADRESWCYIKNFIDEYDASVFSSPKFARQINIPRFFIPPSLDPFNDKNRHLSSVEIKNVMSKYGVETDKPIISQISRFDYSRDPLGAIEVYKLVKKYIDCKLVLAAKKNNDPETEKVIMDVKEKAGDDPDMHILEMDPIDIDVNAIQRASTVIMQKSNKHGFGMTVMESLWKGKPVVASYVGGIPLQITHNYNGLLCRTIEGCAFQIKRILNNPGLAEKLGVNAEEHIRKHYLSTRQLRDYMLLFLYMYEPKDIISLYDEVAV